MKDVVFSYVLRWEIDECCNVSSKIGMPQLKINIFHINTSLLIYCDMVSSGVFFGVCVCVPLFHNINSSLNLQRVIHTWPKAKNLDLEYSEP